jgi:hypothetical protein
MGLKNGLGKRTYLTIREGKIAKNIGDKKYELYDSFEGVIVGMSTKDGLYGQELCLDLKDGGEVYQLQLRIKGEDKPGQSAKQTSHFIAFAHCCPIIDPTKPIEFIPSLKVVDDKKRAALFLKQNGETLKWAFKKGEGMPDPEEVFNKKGELVSVDWSEVEAFRMDKVNEFSAKVREAASFNNMMASEVVEEDSNGSFEEGLVEDSDDLPF